VSRGIFPSLAPNERGSVIIELAIVAPVLALMAIGVIDLSNAYSRKLALEQGAHRAIEKIMQTTDYDSVENTLANEAVCQVNGTNPDGTCKTTPITASNVTVSWRLECMDSGGAMTTQTTSSAAAFDAFVCSSGTTKEARYIQIALTDNYQAIFPVHFSGFASGGYPITATAGMRTQ
jgi:Flp pilus assembly protein TadG